MSEILYPYMPPDRSFHFVSAQDAYMKEAKSAYEEQAGDRLFPVGAVLVTDGRVLARAGNGFNQGSQHRHVCPRIVQECPSGTGYDLCDLHDSPGHAEAMLMQVAKEQGIDPAVCDVYVYGHWWCCQPCWDVMIQRGIRDVYLLENAHVEFDRDRVYARTLQSTVRRVYVAGAYRHNSDVEQDKTTHELVGNVCREFGCEVVSSFGDNAENENAHQERQTQNVYQWIEDRVKESDVLLADVSLPSLGIGGELILAKMFDKPIVLISKKGSLVSTVALGNPNVVYHIVYDTLEEASQQWRNVLKQL